MGNRQKWKRTKACLC